MGSATMSTRERPGERRLDPAIVPIRQEMMAVIANKPANGRPQGAAKQKLNGERKPKVSEEQSLSAEDYIGKLAQRKYLEGGGVARPNWVVFRRPTMDEAFDNAFDDAYRRVPMVSGWDWDVKEAKDAIKNAKMTPRLELLRRRAKEAVEKMLKEIPNLPKDTGSLAVSDAVAMVSILELKSPGKEREPEIKNWQKHYNALLAAEEVWKSGFARFGEVGGSQIVYGKRDDDAAHGMLRS